MSADDKKFSKKWYTFSGFGEIVAQDRESSAGALIVMYYGAALDKTCG